jgi:hypothetical protein
VGLALVALALAVLTWALPPAVTPALAKRVRQGMTVREVEAQFGGPPDARQGNVLPWDGPDGAAFIFLDPGERVVGAAFERWGLGAGHAAAQSPSTFRRLRAWLSR